MTQQRRKAVIFTLEGVNSFSTALYIYYLFFFLERQFGFDKKLNLAYNALCGLIYVFAAYYAGIFGQKRGCLTALKLGYSTMAVALLAGVYVSSLQAHTLVLIGWTIGMCFTWPALEALIAGNESPAGVQRMVGIYNLVWSGTNAVAYFIGGALIEWLGGRSSFALPCILCAAQFIVVVWLSRLPQTTEQPVAPPNAPLHIEPNPRPIARARAFLRLAWLANPCAYVAVNALIPVIPQITEHLGLSTMYAGFYCSIWFFARWLTFAVLWRWDGWHYRFGWLITAYAVMVTCFVFLMWSPNLAVLIGAQILFGTSLGLIYYSSLYYSMDAGDAKSEHGGIHEAAIGAGNFAGPAMSAAALHYFAGYPQSGMIAVAVILGCGFLGLLAIYLPVRVNRVRR